MFTFIRQILASIGLVELPKSIVPWHVQRAIRSLEKLVLRYDDLIARIEADLGKVDERNSIYDAKISQLELEYMARSGVSPEEANMLARTIVEPYRQRSKEVDVRNAASLENARMWRGIAVSTIQSYETK